MIATGISYLAEFLEGSSPGLSLGDLNHVRVSWGKMEPWGAAGPSLHTAPEHWRLIIPDNSSSFLMAMAM